MRSLARGFGLACAVLLAGCAGRKVVTGAPAHGNVLAVTAKHSSRAERRAKKTEGPQPLIVLVERRGVRAIDPETADVKWWLPVRTAGHAVASPEAVYVPVTGHQVVAIDRTNGRVRFRTGLPGEALTGLAISEPWLVASVVDPHKGRSRLAGISTHDGQLRWLRRANARFGVPAAVGRVALAPLTDQVVAFRLSTGREMARLDVPADAGADATPAYERLVLQRDSLVAGQGSRWVDLKAAIGAKVDQQRTVDSDRASLFPLVEGLDPGHSDDERIRLWARFPHDGGMPRTAVLMCRRAIISLRLAPDGRPAKAHWVYRGEGELEFVAMDVARDRITLVREDGQILQLASVDGHELDKIKGDEAVRGALILDVRGGLGDPDGKPPKTEEVREGLLAVLGDADPRLLPAQTLAADLLWRAAEVETRDVVVALAGGQMRPESTDAAEELRGHALDLLAEPWGRDSEAETQRLLADLAVRPSFLQGDRPAIAPLARQAVQSGSREMIPHLVAHLLHPATSSADLGAIMDALSELDHEDAIAGVATFVQRYHADPDVLYESSALKVAVAFLARHTDGERPQGRRARQALHAVAGDPFTDVTLRGYILAALPSVMAADGPPAESANAADEQPGPPDLPKVPASNL